MVQRADVQRGAVPTRGSGFPDYSRAAVGDKKLIAGQDPGGQLLAIISSGAISVSADISGELVRVKAGSTLDAADDDDSTNLRLWESTNASLPVDTKTFPYALGARERFNRMRSLGAFTGSRSGLPLAVGFVSGFQYVGLQDPHASGGAGTRYVAGVFSGASASGAGEFTIDTPASGRALVIKGLTDAHLGASGTVLVGYRLGSGQTPIFEHALTATNPNWEANLIGREVRGPVRNASGQGDLILIVRPAPVSGLSFTAQVTEMTVSGL